MYGIFSLSCLLFLSAVHTTESLFPSDVEIQSLTSQYHSKHHTALICRTGFHHLLICIYCKNPRMSVAAHPEVCVLSAPLPLQLFFTLLPLLLVNRHISIFISRLPQLWAVKCLQAYFFSIFFHPSLSFYASIFSPRACFMHKRLLDLWCHTCTWVEHDKKIHYIIIITTNKQLFECTCTHSVMHYARNGYFNKIIEPLEY